MAIDLQTDAPTGLNIYFQLRNTLGQIWRVDTLVFENYLTVNIAHYNINATEEGSASGYYIATMPTVSIAEYSVVAKIRAGGSPAETDQTIGTGTIDGPYTALDIQVADLYVDTTVTPWALVFMVQGSGGIGVGTEIMRKRLEDVSGANITNTTTVIGQAKQ